MVQAIVSYLDPNIRQSYSLLYPFWKLQACYLLFLQLLFSISSKAHNTTDQRFSACGSQPQRVGVSVAATKHHDQRGVWEERVNLAYASALLFITEGSQDRNSNRAGSQKQELMQRPWRVLLTDLFPLAYSAHFLLEPRTSSPGMAPCTMGPPPLVTS